MPSPVNSLLQQAIDSFWESVPPVWRIIRTHVRSVAVQNYEITVEQFHILRYIRRGGACISTLADTLDLSRPAISQSVDLLVRKGLVTRTQSTSDRRYVELELTEKGAALLNDVFGQARQWMADKMVSLKPQEMQNLTRALQVLQETFIEKYN